MQMDSKAGADWDSDRVTLGRHFLRDMEGLWAEVLKLAAVVESALSTSVRALCDGRADLAAEVRGGEKVINHWEVQIEQACLKVLALHQPVASDLRRVAAALKINNDLERMADLAEHIAKRARKLASTHQPTPIPQELEAMAMEALNAVHDSLDSLANCDAVLARSVIAADRRIDRHRRAVLKQLKQGIRQDPDRVNTWLRLINTARNLERVADHATNIAEAVVYLKEGSIIRHVGERKAHSTD
ncbi:MAG TPA: phosphate signaling complex protein PhoU [Isosphaeraceae bacterium]|jgi:phosphate transport system protein|nr:phosphate signaling complex protein PhoU [Isosphaeraceae bacterium]